MWRGSTWQRCKKDGYLARKDNLGILILLIKKATLSCSEDPGPRGYSGDLKGLNVWGLLGPIVATVGIS